MLSEDLVNKRAEVVTRYLETLIKQLESVTEPNEHSTKLAETLGIFISKTYDLDISDKLSDQIPKLLRKLEQNGLNSKDIDNI